ncbi:TetR/AcrR family transcriptional regulator [Streptomyces kaniharaensis]|uniref:TetR/AcrR family transcriptional regulator n=1 Tax=Streptomyces kaniharaensis TaxID=212423 RepID=A0A6N7L1C8_9ACTN|nr:TetR/AcrR family transcriptional regulator [Streptomyces kaniharaensis]MQS15603.1 TetR/AcrR family transcriptional regulator [Streptomyces kaniharaensis]
MPAKSPTGAFARAQAQGEAALRAALLDIAAGLLAAEGPAALSMRRLAAAADCSTTVLYRLFGAKDAITAALYLEGFARLRRRLDAVPRGDDPAEYLAALGRAYRANALEEPKFYGVMHGEGVPGFVPDESARAAAAASLDVLREAARACVEEGVLRADADVDEITDTLWAAAHGVISLERGGHFPGALGEERFRTLTRAAVSAFLP